MGLRKLWELFVYDSELRILDLKKKNLFKEVSTIYRLPKIKLNNIKG